MLVAKCLTTLTVKKTSWFLSINKTDACSKVSNHFNCLKKHHGS